MEQRPIDEVQAMKNTGYDEQSSVSSRPVVPASATALEGKDQSARAPENSPTPPGHRKVQIYPRRWDLMIFLLAVTGGSVDAVVMRAFDALPGPQSGNTVLLAVALAHGQVPLATTRFAAFVGYLLGGAIGQVMLVRHRASWPWPSAVGTIQIVELMFLGMVFAGWWLIGAHAADAAKDILVAISAMAMGIQSAVVLDLPGEKPTTTYITGMLTTFITRLVQWLHLIETAPKSLDREHEISLATLSLARPWIYGLTWLFYLAGAIAGALLFSSIHENALLLPLVLLATVIALGRNVNTYRAAVMGD
jgi:uncharacterized membrane protein YoaK (UPF0700 family)